MGKQPTNDHGCFQSIYGEYNKCLSWYNIKYFFAIHFSISRFYIQQSILKQIKLGEFTISKEIDANTVFA